jgi:hypothetical protein
MLLRGRCPVLAKCDVSIHGGQRLIDVRGARREADAHRARRRYLHVLTDHKQNPALVSLPVRGTRHLDDESTIVPLCQDASSARRAARAGERAALLLLLSERSAASVADAFPAEAERQDEGQTLDVAQGRGHRAARATNSRNVTPRDAARTHRARPLVLTPVPPRGVDRPVLAQSSARD